MVRTTYVRSLRRADVALVALACALFAVVRVVGAWGRAPVTYPDSNTYRPPPGGLPYDLISFSGRAPRSWFLPVVYSAMPSDPVIVVLQVSGSIAAWIALAATLAASVRNRALRVVAAVLVLALGTTSQVATWDGILLAESLSTSLTVAAVAAWLRYATTRRWLPGAVAVAITAMWLFSRPYQYPYTLGLAAILGLVALGSWWIPRRRVRADAGSPPLARASWLVPAVLAGSLVLGSGWSVVVSANIDDGYRFRDGVGVPYFAEVFGQNLYKRYLHDPEARTFFEERLLPPLDGLEPSPTGPFVNDYDPNWLAFYTEIRQRPAWMAWLEGPARSAFAEYVHTHPFDVLGDFVAETPEMLRSPVLYGPPVEAPGSWLGEQLFFRGDASSIWVGDVQLWLLAAALLGAVCLALRRRPALPVLVVAVVTLGVGASLFFLSWLGSAYELVRHGVPAVQLLRVGSLVLVVALADALAVGARHGSTSATDRSNPERARAATGLEPTGGAGEGPRATSLAQKPFWPVSKSPLVRTDPEPLAPTTPRNGEPGGLPTYER